MALNYDDLARGMEELREALSAMVAGLVSDGFTEVQAREIATAIMCHRNDDDE